MPHGKHRSDTPYWSRGPSRQEQLEADAEAARRVNGKQPPIVRRKPAKGRKAGWWG